MKILHINALQQGGAAICARRISNAVSDWGCECKMLTIEGEAHDNVVVAEQDPIGNDHPLIANVKHSLRHTSWYWDETKLQIAYWSQMEGMKEHPYINFPITKYKNIADHELVEWADIIHLHWVAGMIDYPTFFRKIKKPIVWTFHDKNPVMGLFHYESFHIFESLKDLDEICRNIKRKALRKKKNVHIVAISKAMVQSCNSSPIVNNLPIHLIHNGVNTRIFEHYDKQNSRDYLGIPQNANVFMFSALDINDTNKGLDRIIEAIKQASIPNKLLICCGRDNEQTERSEVHFPIIYMGEVKDLQILAKLYSASDFFIQASFEESFGQTVVEAMSCGTPVISTMCGIAPELISSFNGILCTGYDSDSLRLGIEQGMTQTYNNNQIRQNILENYDYTIIGKQYVSLYESL